MERRSFLKGLVGVIAAPAVVKASSLMPIWVPKNAGGIIIPDHIVVPVSLRYCGINKTNDPLPGDFINNTVDCSMVIFDGKNWVKIDAPPEVNSAEYFGLTKWENDIKGYHEKRICDHLYSNVPI